MISAILVSFLLYQHAPLVSAGPKLTNDAFSRPIDLVEIAPGDCWVLDQGERTVFHLKNDGISSQIGRRGQGPGEFQAPIEITQHGELLLIYDKGKGTLASFTNAGAFVSETKIARATSGQFLRDRIILHTPLTKNLFQVFDFLGNQISVIGTGMGEFLDLKRISAYLKIFHSTEDTLHFVSQDGQRISKATLADGHISVRPSLGFDFSEFMRKKEVRTLSIGRFTIENEQPIQSLAYHQDVTWLIVKNERESKNGEESTYLIGFNSLGKLVYFSLTPYYVRKLSIQKGKMYLFNFDEAFVAGFHIPTIAGNHTHR